jgi:hypothetical protein
MGVVYSHIGNGLSMAQSLHLAQRELCGEHPSLALFTAFGTA